MKKVCPISDLNRFFKPRNVAVIGASSEPGKIGYKTFFNLVNGGFKGGMYPINVKGEEVLGFKVLRSVMDIPVEVDLVLICIPAQFVNGALIECGEKGVPFAVVITSGFKEIGNVEGENEIVATAKRYGIRVLGPNVFGMVYTPAGLNAQFGPEKVLAGNVAIITQSGSLGIALMDRVFQEGLGVSALTSVGNKSDLSDEEILDYLCTDENTKLILMYIEGLKDGRVFMEKVKNVSRSKPIIILKSGRSKAGAKAIASHTASLAGQDSIFDAAFRQCGAIRAPTLREALEWTRTLNDLPLPKEDGILIITNGGGFGILAIDRCGLEGLPIYYNLEWISRRLGPLLPAYATLSNPVDITAQTPPEGYIECLRRALEEPSVGSVIGIFGAVSGVDVEALTKDLIATVGRPSKPLVLCYIGGKDADGQVRAFNEAGLPAFHFPEEAVSSMQVLYKYRAFLREEQEKDELVLAGWDLKKVRKLVTKGRKNGWSFLPLEDSMEFLKAGPYKVAEYRIVKDLDGAVMAAKELGFPLVIKGSSSQLIHKTERGGVVTDIDGMDELIEAFQKVRGISDKVLVMEQVSGREIIASAIRDPVFGPCVMFGLGGIMVEAVHDVTFRVAPITKGEALRMLDDIKGKAVLGNFRGKGEVDRKELAVAVKALGDLLVQVPEITDIEVNPLFVSEKRAVAVDCRVRIEPVRKDQVV